MSPEPRAPRPTLWPAALVGAWVLACALGVGALLQASEERALEAATATALEAVGSEVENRMRDHVGALRRFARDWERRGGLSQAEFQAAARDLAADFDYVQAVEWVDRDFRVRRIEPLAGNEAALGLDLAFEARRRAALEASRDGRTIKASRPIQLVQGGLGFIVYVPLHVEDRFDGFVLGVYRAGELLSALLRNMAPGFDIRIADADEVLFGREAASGATASARVGTVRVADQDWSIEVAPGPEIVATYQTQLPAVVVFGGAFFALGLAITTQLARARRIRNQRLAAEVERRRRAEEELSMVVDALPDHVWSADLTPEGVEPGYFSPVIERITGYPMETFLKAPERWMDIVHDADRERVRRVHRDLLKGEREAFAIEYRIVAADGGVRWVRERVQATPIVRGRRLDGVTSDITEIKRGEEERLELEATVQRAQKLESLGVLAGGIAHDFNNLMVGVLGHARLALEDLSEDAPAREAIGRVERAARRAAELCRQMLAYAGQVSIEEEPLDLREAVEEAGALLSASTPKKIDVVYDFEEALPLVEADATQIRQVLLNLITNASEAIGDRVGTIRVSAVRREYGRTELDGLEMGRDLEAGPYVVLTVADDGCGMDEETRRRFMEPFYSTKFSGRGLGLAAVQGIVRRHGGAIEAESQAGEGTSVTLLLPALDARAAPAAQTWPRRSSEPSAPADRQRSGTLLLIDDDEDARELGTHVLARAGYRVLTAIDGVEGVAALRAHHEEVDCVLLDLTMPRLDGAEALGELRAVCDVPVILCSGYPEPAAMERFAELDLAGFIAKPYLPEDLLALLDRTLAGGPSWAK